jgi:hypothetical protein
MVLYKKDTIHLRLEEAVPDSIGTTVLLEFVPLIIVAAIGTAVSQLL